MPLTSPSLFLATQRYSKAFCLLLLVASSCSATVAEVRHNFESELGLELRTYTENGQFTKQNEHNGAWDPVPAAFFSSEWHASWADGNQSFTLKPFVRIDGSHSDRAHWDLREAHWLGVYEQWEILIGVSKVFWGKTELLHLVDVINQTDTLEGADGEDKLGQPMLRLSWSGDNMNLQGFVLPYFRERRHVNEKGRLRPPLPINDKAALYESGAEEEHIDVALRMETWFGGFDIGVSAFSGTQRSPKLIPNGPVISTTLPPALSTPLLPLLSIAPNAFFTVDFPDSLIPIYGQMNQLSVDAQHTSDNWLWKLEVLWRDEDNSLANSIYSAIPADEQYSAATGGFEYSFYDLAGSGIDIGLVSEYLWDERGNHADNSFQNDFFIGARIAGNDVDDHTVLIGLVEDLNNHGRLHSIEFSRRIDNSGRLSLEARVFDRASEEDPLLSAIEKDDFIELQYIHYF